MRTLLLPPALAFARTMLARVFCVALLLGAASAVADDLNCDLSSYVAANGLQASVRDNQLTVSWTGEPGENFRAIFGIVQAQPTILELAVQTGRGGKWSVIGRDLVPTYEVASGIRRFSNQQVQALSGIGVPITDELIEREKWNTLWDAPLEVPGISGTNLNTPRKPEEVHRAASSFATQGCRVVTNGGRLEINFPGLALGIFSGSVQYTVYRGSNLLRQEAIARTMEPSVAYKYNAGLKGFALADTDRVVWRDVAAQPQEYEFGGSPNNEPVALRARNRLAVLERAGGSIGFFPPPHKFFFAREIDVNLGYVYYLKDSNSTFRIGVRQADHEGTYMPYGFSDELWKTRVDHARRISKGNFALYNAPAGTWQHMAAYFYLSGKKADGAMEGVLRYTHGDRYPALPGYKVSIGHFHTHFWEEEDDAKTLDLQPPWIPAFRSLGVNIAIMSDFHSDGHISEAGPFHFREQKIYFDASRRHSDRNFLILPGEEPSAYFGGHYTTVFPHPVFWSHTRVAGQTFIEQDPVYGRVYHVSNAQEEMEMIRQEGGVVWQSHPRTKGSTGFPDASKDTPAFNSTFFLGASFQSLPVDQSTVRLGERCFSVLDDMNNWAGPKYMPAEGDTYTKAPDDDIYGALWVNYVKLDKVPLFDESWQPFLDSLHSGTFFVTTGEVLIPHWEVKGTGATRTVEAQVKWTFPLEFIEVVWGDGTTVDRKIIPATELAQFGENTFKIPFPAAGKKWVRFAAWDSAGEGAFTQPIQLGK